MITEIPTQEEFNSAGLDSLYLAWQITMRAIAEFTTIQELWLGENDNTVDFANYYRKSQPALGNAYGLIQQAAELAVKARIAAISPFLLIARDPKDWPKGVAERDVPFSEFRTLDSADLIKAHNAVSANKLDQQFQIFWDKLRRDRNKIMHSVTPQNIDPSTLLKNILTVAQTLFYDERWPKRLLDMQFEGTWADYGYYSDYTQNIVMDEIDKAIGQLDPAECKKFFGFNPSLRAYRCPHCWNQADTDMGDDIPRLAQLLSRDAEETNVRCIVCEVVSTIERLECHSSVCKGNVVSDGRCLTCGWEQDSPHQFPSGLAKEESQGAKRYFFCFKRGGQTHMDQNFFSDDGSAIEHARLTFTAPHLSSWTSVIIEQQNFNLIPGIHREDRIIGSWLRTDDGLVWQSGLISCAQ